MLQFLFDTDHLTLYEYRHPPLMRRMAQYPADSVAISPINIEEIMRGRLGLCRDPEGSMSLKDDFRTALTSGRDLDHLVELVDRQLDQGMSRREIIRILHELWLELGFEDADRPDSVQESLEFVLEKVSDDCPFTG